MVIESIELNRYRNYKHLSLRPHEGINLFYGKNGSGKTNLLEAVHYCALGKSHRITQDAHAVMAGESSGSCSVSVRGRLSKHEIGIRLQPGESLTDLRMELGLPQNAFLVLSVGELNENKNQQVIIRAIAQLKDPDIHYVLCGRGDRLDALKALAGELGVSDRVHFLGYRKDIADICRQCDVFAMPSRREGLSFATIEAKYCGLPVVNSGIGGLKDITEDGLSGYVCSPEDAQQYAESIRRLKNNPELRKQMGEHNRKTVADYTLEQTKQEILRLIRELLS